MRQSIPPVEGVSHFSPLFGIVQIVKSKELNGGNVSDVSALWNPKRNLNPSSFQKM